MGESERHKLINLMMITSLIKTEISHSGTYYQLQQDLIDYLMAANWANTSNSLGISTNNTKLALINLWLGEKKKVCLAQTTCLTFDMKWLTCIPETVKYGISNFTVMGGLPSCSSFSTLGRPKCALIRNSLPPWMDEKNKKVGESQQNVNTHQSIIFDQDLTYKAISIKK